MTSQQPPPSSAAAPARGPLAFDPGRGAEDIDSVHAWIRLAFCLAVITAGGSGMYLVVVVLPAVQAEFGIARADASLPYALTLLGYAVGSLMMGRLSDRYGVIVSTVLGAVMLGAGFVWAGMATSLATFATAQGLLIGIGSSVAFVPMITEVSFWFARRRGIAVAISASGNYLSGVIWPPLAQHYVETVGWRTTYIWVGLICALLMIALATGLRRPRPMPPVAPATGADGLPSTNARPLGMSPNTLVMVLVVAGVACCVAMSMPQVHIVAYCGDLGYGATRGAQMLSVMLGFGIVSRLVSGLISDRIGGLRTLVLGSALQGIALALFLPFDSMASLYVIAALFGLFQGGIVPSYAIIVRELLPPEGVGARVGLVMTATMLGMALGGWMSGRLFDLTGSYNAAFYNGIAWNLLNLSIAGWLLMRARRIARDGGLRSSRV